MVKLSDLTTADEIHERDMADPAYRAENERTRFANDIAIRVLTYRTEHGLTQTAFGRLVGMRQPHVARFHTTATTQRRAPRQDLLGVGHRWSRRYQRRHARRRPQLPSDSNHPTRDCPARRPGNNHDRHVEPGPHRRSRAGVDPSRHHRGPSHAKPRDSHHQSWH